MRRLVRGDIQGAPTNGIYCVFECRVWLKGGVNTQGPRPASCIPTKELQRMHPAPVSDNVRTLVYGGGSGFAAMGKQVSNS